jgi:hypothetical protein
MFYSSKHHSHILFLPLFSKSVKNKFLFTMTAYPSQTRMTLGQLCTALWDSQSWPDVIHPGFEPGTVVKPLALRCSALHCCATRETEWFILAYYNMLNQSICNCSYIPYDWLQALWVDWLHFSSWRVHYYTQIVWSYLLMFWLKCEFIVNPSASQMSCWGRGLLLSRFWWIWWIINGF